MSSKSPSLFSDLLEKDAPEIQTMYEAILAQLSSTEEQLLSLYKTKKMHSEVIKFAVSKTNQPPKPTEKTRAI